jgi:DNA-binding GntR family transcriptional regulator
MLKPFKPGSLVEQIYRNLCEAIMNGALPPGQLLKEQELQKNFNVSRAPIREVIRLLEADRLVVVSAYKKKYVRQITRGDLEEIIPVLACLEGCAARLAAGKFYPEQIKAFRSLNDDMKKAFAAGDMDACNDLNFKFHGSYIKAAGNEALKQAVRPIVKRIIRLWITTLYHKKPSLFHNTISEHEKIIRAFVDRDAKGAEAGVREHIEGLLDRVLKASVFDKNGHFQIG